MHREQEGKDKRPLAAVCGLYCGACTLYIGSTEDTGRLNQLARLFGSTPDELRCHGCRSARLGLHCRGCEFRACARERKISFCSECDEYPCAKLVEFERQRPHRAELWNDLDRVKEVGVHRWIREKEAEYACPRCGTLNSAYDLFCRKCGGSPSCAYVAKHQEAVKRFTSQMQKRPTK